jgi:hypothetical protein
MGAAPHTRISRRQLLAGLAAAYVLGRRTLTHARAETFADLVARCDCCVTGRSLGASSEWWTLAGRRRIVTVHRFAVDHVLAGEAAGGDELLVRTLGGVIGDYGERVIGEAELRVGEPALLLLTAAEPGVHVVSGMEHGRFRVVREADGVERLHAPQRAHAAASPTAVLEGARLSEAQALVAQAWQEQHAR